MLPEHPARTASRVNEARKQRVEVRDVVRDAGQHRRHDQAGVDAGIRQLLQARSRAAGTGERASSLRASAASAVISEMWIWSSLRIWSFKKQIAVARDQRALGDDPERQSLAPRQPLQHRARQANVRSAG
jgi:hypothetical protein